MKNKIVRTKRDPNKKVPTYRQTTLRTSKEEGI